MGLGKMTVEFELIKLAQKLNYGSEQVKEVDRMLRDTDLTIKENVEKIRNFLCDLEMFLKEFSS